MIRCRPALDRKKCMDLCDSASFYIRIPPKRICRPSCGFLADTMLAVECYGTLMHTTGLGDLGSYNRDHLAAREPLD